MTVCRSPSVGHPERVASDLRGAPDNPRTAGVLAFATLGRGSSDEARIRDLLRDVGPVLLPFDRSRKLRMFWRILREVRRGRPDLVVMEGTGLAGGAALILARALFGQRYVVSSGDAVGPWVGTRVRPLGPVFGLYERLLCRWAAGFIGWTPYLVGRALTFGTPRGVTAAGWAPFHRTPAERDAARHRVRSALGIPADALVIGIAGSMVWTPRYRFCYGAELVRALAVVRRPDVYALLVGDGTGRRALEAEAGDRAGRSVIFTGRVPQAEVPDYLAAMDLGSLPQSVDRTGGFRYTTKISEYLDAGLPVVTGQIPMGYDLDGGWIWRLPGDAPWEGPYIRGLADLLDRLTPNELAARRAIVPAYHPTFDREQQIRAVTALVSDLLARLDRGEDAHG
jgi:Glycosyl transferases group 1